jgi:hypothetical protein
MMSEPAALEGWRRELAPWLAALKNRLEIDVPAMPTLDDLEDLWILFEAQDATDYEPRQWTLILEALELLDLLVRVDAVTGWQCLFSVADQPRTFRTFQEALFPYHELLPRYVLGHIDSQEISPYFQSVFLALRRMIGEEDQPWEPPSSPEFARVKQLLLDAWARNHCGRTFDRAREGRIRVGLEVVLSSIFQAQPVPFMVQQTLRLAMASRSLLPQDERAISSGSESTSDADPNTEQLQVRQRRAVFCFVAVDVELLEHPATNEVLYHLLHLASEGVPITGLVLDQIVMPQLHFSIAGSFFMEVLGVWSARDRGLTRFEFSCGRFDRDTVGAVCSALALSQTISEFAFTDSRSGRDADGNLLPGQMTRSVWWPWLAYALFSQDARNDIQSVQLDVNDFTMSDLDAMRAVLDHANPLAYVCALDEPEPKSPVLSTPPTVAILKPRTRVAIGHRIVIAHEENFVDRGSATLTTNAPHQIVRNNETEDFVEIVFPGSGVGWIERSKVQEIVSSERRENMSIKCLKLESISASSYPAVLELLRLVGGHLESLTLDPLGPLPDDFLKTVSTVCPLLKSLHLEHQVESTRWLVSLGDADGPRCRLERLVLPAQVTDQGSLGSFLKALSCGDHEISKSLREICFGSPWSRLESDAVLPEFRFQWLEMLRSNWRLEQCVLQCGKEVEADVTFLKELGGHNGERIFVPQTLAFLSVLTNPSRRDHKGKRLKLSATTQDPTSVRFMLPRETAELILEMAGVPLQRICA